MPLGAVAKAAKFIIVPSGYMPLSREIADTITRYVYI